MLCAAAVAILLSQASAATQHTSARHRYSTPKLADNGTCAPLPTAQEVPDLFLLGEGHCVNALGLTPLAFACNASASPECAAVSANAVACAAQCALDDGCTGFELRTDPTSGAAQCMVFFSSVPLTLPWVVGDEGTQWANSSRRTVVTTASSSSWSSSSSAAATSVASPGVGDASSVCCYRRSYPRPLPVDMPILTPPQQSWRAKEVFARMAARAAEASAAVLPALETFIGYCAENATDAAGNKQNLFGVALCPGMADLTANGTLAPYPTPAQIVQRFSDEMRAVEFVHGYDPLWNGIGCNPAPCVADITTPVNPLLSVLPNLFQPITLGWNGSSPGNTASWFTPIMTDVFGCDRFANGAAFTYNFTEAADRVMYTLNNYCRSPMGARAGLVETRRCLCSCARVVVQRSVKRPSFSVNVARRDVKALSGLFASTTDRHNSLRSG
jgi:hypothetical protein